jgi:demethylmenaquinone methyltransferase / 2-methoxy-6-polyprenyl-1,4-benzoquinol methylase
MNLRAALASTDSKAPYVRRLFHTIADRYDLITVLFSYGRDRRWKERLVTLADVRAGQRALDLAAGHRRHRLRPRGTRRARRRARHHPSHAADCQGQASSGAAAVAFVTGDMMALPFPDEAFDLVTIGYRIRNVPVIEPAIAEIRRVLRPGGLVLSLDFDRPRNAVVRGLYLGYLTVVGSAVGWILHRDPDTYRYIPESIDRYPGAAGVGALLARTGFADSRVIPLLGGLMAINVARKTGL